MKIIFFTVIKKNDKVRKKLKKSINIYINQIDNYIKLNAMIMLKHDIYAFLYLVKTTKKFFIAYTTRRLNA